MANSRYEYVRTFERESKLLPSTYIVIRIDGRSFHKFSNEYQFEKPNDLKALKVMNLSALKLMQLIPDILLAYGDSDEYSFLLRKDCELFERREFKLITTFSSLFSANYQYYWNVIMVDKPLNVDRLPTFDARAVCYPNEKTVRDYFSWRQVDCHINNLYNTTFWNLVLKGNLSNQQAENKLIGTLSSDKNEILFKQFGINYNDEPDIFKKGTIYVKHFENYNNNDDDNNNNNHDLSKRQMDRFMKKLKKCEIVELHCDLIKDEFWDNRPWLLM
ncbi:hypothetical protein CANARDRAFT_197154 [[Candida] arabinofermentans NRRL YB-2248]|uniref:tRNA(His) guanylyltransferase n=1 Tax=[Candida] arabinofermentans NRRL YB-2248 TaxID=983967 RepID=A0A1E4T3A2_9ASCO|nr:hypothetical protein CANARDRAFT_197154 [[Candida] arabinofermentans NRRL YB-2248]